MAQTIDAYNVFTNGRQFGLLVNSEKNETYIILYVDNGHYRLGYEYSCSTQYLRKTLSWRKIRYIYEMELLETACKECNVILSSSTLNKIIKDINNETITFNS